MKNLMLSSLQIQNDLSNLGGSYVKGEETLIWRYRCVSEGPIYL